MKICVFSDIHGNIDAFNLLAQTTDFLQADLRVFLGDALVMGPYPNECCELLLKHNCIWIMGNHDSYIAYGLGDNAEKFFRADKLEHQAYMRNLTLNCYKEHMKTLPKDYLLEVNGEKLYFTHYPWKNEKAVLDNPATPNLADEQKLFNNVNASYIFHGHEHKHYTFNDKNKTYVCVGSLGMEHPGHYSVITTANNGIKIEHKTINFNLDKYKSDILNANYPRATKYVKFFDN